MALQTSGAISFSQIVTEFGGAGQHAMSEYYALAGLGVTGIPASGAISFSTFYGKSNQVTTSVWVSSGYNTTSWVMTIGSTYNVYNPTIYVRKINSSGRYFFNWGGIIPSNTYVYTTTMNYNGYQYRRGASHSHGSATQPRWYIQQWQYQTNWTDTSGYVDTITTVQITT